MRTGGRGIRERKRIKLGKDALGNKLANSQAPCGIQILKNLSGGQERMAKGGD